MAISLKTAGTWARVVADPSSVSIPGTPAAGDRMFLFANWKTFDVTVADPANWTPIVNSFADGTTAAGNGTGSVSVAAWYRDWQTGDANPSLNWSAAPTEAHAVVMLWTKAGGDTWSTPQYVTAAIAANDPFSATASSTLTIADASVVMCMIALRDDSTTIARSATTAIGNGSVTWNGNYVESPAAHFNSTTGLDMSGDLGHRFVTTGGAGVSLTTTGDPAAAETGTALWVAQALFVSDPKTAEPTALSLTLTGATPTVTASDHKSATPTALSMTFTGAESTVAVSDNQFAEPSPLALTWAGDTPTVLTPVQSSPTPLSMALAGDVPAVLTPIATAPTALGLTLTGAVPDVQVSSDENIDVLPDPLELALTLDTPTVGVTDNIQSQPSAAALALTFATPVVTVTQNQLAIPTPLALRWRGMRPLVVVSGQTTASGMWQPPDERLPHPQHANPKPLPLGLAWATPEVRIGDDADVFALFTGVA